MRIPLLTPWLPAFALVWALMAWPSLLNGYPLVFYDSADYIEGAFSFDVPVFRVLPYAALVALGKSLGGLWGVVALQGLAITAAIALLARALGGPRGWPLFLGLGVLALAASWAPWYAGLVMPDAFTAPSLLSALLLLVYRQRLGRWAWAAAGLLVLSAPLHATHLLVLAGMALLGLLLSLPHWVERRSAKIVLALTLLSWLLVPALHRLMLGEWTYNRAGSVFLLARLVESGLAQRELDRICAEKSFLICSIKEKLYGDENEFLWGRAGVFFGRSGDVGQWVQESGELVGRIVMAHPGEVARGFISHAAWQFVSFGPGDVFTPMKFHMGAAIEKRLPLDYPRLLSARQEAGWALAERFAVIALPVQALGAGALVLLAVLRARRGRRDDALFALLLLLGLAGNALACGGLSSVADRYQARLIWIAPLAALALVRTCRPRPGEADFRGA
jgi:hypothetical protein